MFIVYMCQLYDCGMGWLIRLLYLIVYVNINMFDIKYLECCYLNII